MSGTLHRERTPFRCRLRTGATARSVARAIADKLPTNSRQLAAKRRGQCLPLASRPTRPDERQDPVSWCERIRKAFPSPCPAHRQIDCDCAEKWRDAERPILPPVPRGLTVRKSVPPGCQARRRSGTARCRSNHPGSRNRPPSSSWGVPCMPDSASSTRVAGRVRTQCSSAIAACPGITGPESRVRQVLQVAQGTPATRGNTFRRE